MGILRISEGAYCYLNAAMRHRQKRGPLQPPLCVSELPHLLLLLQIQRREEAVHLPQLRVLAAAFTPCCQRGGESRSRDGGRGAQGATGTGVQALPSRDRASGGGDAPVGESGPGCSACVRSCRCKAALKAISDGGKGFLPPSSGAWWCSGAGGPARRSSTAALRSPPACCSAHLACSRGNPSAAT